MVIGNIGPYGYFGEITISAPHLFQNYKNGPCDTFKPNRTLLLKINPKPNYPYPSPPKPITTLIHHSAQTLNLAHSLLL